MKKGDGISIMGVHHWEGGEYLPVEVLNLVKEGGGYHVTWELLQKLTESYDIQFFHQTVQLGNHNISGLFLMLDRAGGRHRQR